MHTKGHILVLGFGYTGERLAKSLLDEGWKVTGTVRDGSKRIEMQIKYPLMFFEVINDQKKLTADHLEDVTHILDTAPVDKDSGRDPFLNSAENVLQQYALSGRNFWTGYLSTTGVYGDADGDTVDENCQCNATTERGLGRIRAEKEWMATGLPVHVFRLPGIYGPFRGIVTKVRDGTQRRIVKENQFFSRIHVDDIVGAIIASIDTPNPGRIYNVTDDYSCPNAEVVEYAANLLKMEVPPAENYDDVVGSMSAMARSFYDQSRKVNNSRLKDELGYKLKYPTYKEGFRAQIEEEDKSN